MTGLELLAPIIGGIGAATSLAGSIQSGNAQAEQAKQQAAAARAQSDAELRKANEQQAVSQRQAQTDEQKAQIAMSRGQALAAASGGGATDPTVLKLAGDVAGQGEYNALASLYTGNAQAAGLREQSDIDLWKSSNTLAAIPTIRTASLLSGVSSFASAASKMKYGS